jgi:uncharacterized protein
LLCRVFGKCLAGDVLDREVGDMIGVGSPKGSNKLFTYTRYNPQLTVEGLKALALPHIKPEDVQMLDSVEHIKELQEVGRAVAKGIKAEHFDGFV